MTETKTTTIGAARTTVSGEIEGVLRKARDTIDRIDSDPIIRLALARVTIRTFTRELVASHPDSAIEIANEFEEMAELVRANASLPAEIQRALNSEQDGASEAPDRGEKTNAEDRQSVGAPRGGGQADPEGRDAERADRKGARHHGAKRIGKEHAVLRVGGS